MPWTDNEDEISKALDRGNAHGLEAGRIQREALEAELVLARDCLQYLTEENDRWRTEVSVVRAERDAAVAEAAELREAFVAAVDKAVTTLNGSTFYTVDAERILQAALATPGPGAALLAEVERLRDENARTPVIVGGFGLLDKTLQDLERDTAHAALDEACGLLRGTQNAWGETRLEVSRAIVAFIAKHGKEGT